jgi:hypothetical protein
VHDGDPDAGYVSHTISVTQSIDRVPLYRATCRARLPDSVSGRIRDLCRDVRAAFMMTQR